MQQNDIPTWGLVMMLISSVIGSYFLARDLIARCK